ncbi:hypothetical protein FB451DRAFT_1398680 [Mycena latifolia]|nr:hypothetical protein FB451DRAFT_1398680 [Mycena latifolia]
MCVPRVRLHSTGIKNASPLRTFGLFHAGSSTADSIALGCDLRDVYVSFPAERANHKSHYIFQDTYGAFPPCYRSIFRLEPSKCLKSHGGFRSCYIAASRRDPASLPADEQFPICTRDSFGAFYAFSRGSACLGMHRNPWVRSEGRRSLGMAARAREGQRVRSFEVRRTRRIFSPAVRLRYQAERGRAHTALYGEGSCVCGGALPRTREVHAVRRRESLDCAESFIRVRGIQVA